MLQASGMSGYGVNWRSITSVPRSLQGVKASLTFCRRQLAFRRTTKGRHARATQAHDAAAAGPLHGAESSIQKKCPKYGNRQGAKPFACNWYRRYNLSRRQMKEITERAYGRVVPWKNPMTRSLRKHPPAAAYRIMARETQKKEQHTIQEADLLVIRSRGKSHTVEFSPFNLLPCFAVNELVVMP